MPVFGHGEHNRTLNVSGYQHNPEGGSSVALGSGVRQKGRIGARVRARGTQSYADDPETQKKVNDKEKNREEEEAKQNQIKQNGETHKTA